MSARVKHIRKWVFRAILLLVAAGIAAPFIAADRFHDRIQAALQNALHRKVEIGKVHLTLFSGPGFVVEDVLIDEDPAVGVEPFAFVSSLDARVKLTSLLRLRLEFSSLTLDEPSVNLVKPGEQSWNVVPLIVNTMTVPTNSGHPQPAFRELPAIKIRGGRIDLKFGDTKSTFYLTNANVDITPRSAGAFDVDFSGEPARTDRASQGFGSFTAKGRYSHTGIGEPRLDFTVELERNAIDDLARGFAGRDFGLHGIVSSRATIKGPLSDLQVAGQMQLADIHRWDFIPTGNTGSLRFAYRGTVDWGAQTLDIASSPAENSAAPVKWRVRLFDFMAKPRWATELAVENLPADAVVNASRHMGVPLPSEFTLDGSIAGVVGYSSVGGLQGKVMLAAGAVRLSPETRLELRDAELSLEGDHLRVAPVQVTGDDGQTAELSAEYSLSQHAMHLQIDGKSLRIAELQTGSGNILASAAVPFVENFSRGKWTGSLEYNLADGAPGRWSGEFDLREARVQVPGLAQPVNVSSASVSMEGNRVAVTKMRAHAGTVEFTGEYHYEPGATNPHRFSLSIPALDLGDAEQLLLPTLRREQGFFARTLRRAVAPPKWLLDRQAEGTLRVGTLSAGALELRDVRGHVLWDAANVQITNVNARVEDARATGQVGIDLVAAQPAYRIRGRVQDLTWRGGKVDFDTKIATRGTGTDFLLNLHSEGTFDAKALTISPDTPLRTASGLYEFTVSAFGPRIKLTGLEAAMGTERFSGQGNTLADGKVQIELASNTRVLRATGALVPLRLDVTVAHQ